MDCGQLLLRKNIEEMDKEKVAQVARAALNFLSKHAIPITPRNFEDWFFVVCKAVEENHLLTDKNLFLLYDKYFKDKPIVSGDLEKIQEVSKGLKEIAVGSEKALEKFEDNLHSHDSYLQESIKAIDEQDLSKVETLRSKISSLEEENQKLKKFLEAHRHRLEEIEAKFNKEKKAANHDALTGLLNRRRFDEDMQRLHETGKHYSIIMLDIDNFKKINDTYGHLVGDQVLKEVGEILRNYIRSNTNSYRYGGEEFVIILEGADEKAAKAVAERLREVIANRDIHINSGSLNVTASFGATTKKDHQSTKEIMEQVDKALYRAKKEGKNRVVVL